MAFEEKGILVRMVAFVDAYDAVVDVGLNDVVIEQRFGVGVSISKPRVPNAAC